MPTPSFEKRMRNRIGKTVHFSYKTPRKSVREVTVRVSDVEWVTESKRYEFVGKNARDTRGNRISMFRIPTKAIVRPVRVV